MQYGKLEIEKLDVVSLKDTYQKAINTEFIAIVNKLSKINGFGEKTRICEILGISARMGVNLFGGKNNVKPFYLEQVKARLRNAKGI